MSLKKMMINSKTFENDEQLKLFKTQVSTSQKFED